MNSKVMAEGRILCLLTSPKNESQPFGVSVYAVDAGKPHRILEAVSPRSEIQSFLSLLQEGSRTSEQITQALSADPCV